VFCRSESPTGLSFTVTILRLATLLSCLEEKDEYEDDEEEEDDEDEEELEELEELEPDKQAEDVLSSPTSPPAGGAPKSPPAAGWPPTPPSPAVQPEEEFICRFQLQPTDISGSGGGAVSTCFFVHIYYNNNNNNVTNSYINIFIRPIFHLNNAIRPQNTCRRSSRASNYGSPA
jgi:hypothetical protein